MGRMKLLVALLPLVLGACAMTAQPPPLPPLEGPVALGQTAYPGGPLVTPVELVEDSRCPINARCIWAGRVVVRITIRGHAGDESWQVQRDLELGKPQSVADGTIALVAVLPERMTDADVRPGDYRFTFEFQGGL